jgi:hypothetical protein
MPIDLSRPFKSFAPNFLVLVIRIHYKWLHCNRLARRFFLSLIDVLYKRVWGMEIYYHNYILTPLGFSRQRHTGSHSAPCVHWARGWVGSTVGTRGLWVNQNSATNLNTVSVIVRRRHVFCARSAYNDSIFCGIILENFRTFHAISYWNDFHYFWQYVVCIKSCLICAFVGGCTRTNRHIQLQEASFTAVWENQLLFIWRWFEMH